MKISQQVLMRWNVCGCHRVLSQRAVATHVTEGHTQGHRGQGRRDAVTVGTADKHSVTVTVPVTVIICGVE